MAAASLALDSVLPARSVLVVGGVPGAGKSTFLRKIDTPARVLDSEDVRDALPRALDRVVPYRALRPVVHAAHYARIATAMFRAGPLIVHETATRSRNRRLLAAVARLAGREAHLLFIDVDRESSEQGMQSRHRVLPRGSLERHFARWTRLRRDARAGELAREGWASVTLIDRAGADRVQTIEFAPARSRGALALS